MFDYEYAIKVMRRASKGEAVQGKLRAAEKWNDLALYSWNWDLYNYRIKPESFDIEDLVDATLTDVRGKANSPELEFMLDGRSYLVSIDVDYDQSVSVNVEELG